MEESNNTIETKRFGDNPTDKVFEQRLDSLNPVDNSSYASTEVGLTTQNSAAPRYEVRNGNLYKLEGAKEVCLANFHLEISTQHLRMDEGIQVRRDLKLDVHLNDRTIPVIV